MASTLTTDATPSLTPTTPLLDHIVILVPHAFVAAPPAWLREAFTVYPGGRHADGRTENVLVLLADGAYLEFIAFVPGLDPEARRCHRWGREAEGTVIDWALTLPTGDEDGKGAEDGVPQAAAFGEVREKVARAGTSLTYGSLVAGGRTRPDGEVLRWATAAAYRSVAATATAPPPQDDVAAGTEPVEPGSLPFWCLDATPRALRVPYRQDGVTTHGCGAFGPALVALAPVAGARADLERVYGALLGTSSSGPAPSWALRTPAGQPEHPVAHIRLDGDGAPGSLRLHLFTNKSDFAGRIVGGEVGQGLSLAFELVYTGPQ